MFLQTNMCESWQMEELRELQPVDQWIRRIFILIRGKQKWQQTLIIDFFFHLSSSLESVYRRILTYALGRKSASFLWLPLLAFSLSCLIFLFLCKISFKLWVRIYLQYLFFFSISFPIIKIIYVYDRLLRKQIFSEKIV